MSGSQSKFVRGFRQDAFVGMLDAIV